MPCVVLERGWPARSKAPLYCRAWGTECRSLTMTCAELPGRGSVTGARIGTAVADWRVQACLAKEQQLLLEWGLQW